LSKWKKKEDSQIRESANDEKPDKINEEAVLLKKPTVISLRSIYRLGIRDHLSFPSPCPRQPVSIKKLHKKLDTPKKLLVFTGISPNERDDLLDRIEELQSTTVLEVMNKRVTHVIVGQERRTLKVVQAMAMGVWIVSKTWIDESFAAGKWLNEEPYQIQIWKGTHKSKNRSLLFTEKFYVHRKTIPAPKLLEDLLTICGGNIVTLPNYSDICISPTASLRGLSKLNIPVVHEMWVIESISQNKRLEVTPFLAP